MNTMKPSKIRKVFNKHVRIGTSFEVEDAEGKTFKMFVTSGAFIVKNKGVFAYCSRGSVRRWGAKAVPAQFIISKLFAKDPIPDEDPA